MRKLEEKIKTDETVTLIYSDSKIPFEEYACAEIIELKQ